MAHGHLHKILDNRIIAPLNLFGGIKDLGFPVMHDNYPVRQVEYFRYIMTDNN